jgi:hypothetical protein
MKKRFPTLIVLATVFMVLGVLLAKRSCSSKNEDMDRDKDGVVNDQDACPDVYAKTPNGCPKVINPTNDNDRDRDGYLGGFQKNPKLKDRDDSDPCIPNPTCDYCDYDGDGLTYPQEKAKNTEPTKKDTDGDGINDKLDRCPRDYGIVDNDGCKLVIDVMLNRIKSKNKKQRIIWNSQLINHCERIMLTINDYEADKTYEIPIVNKTEHICKSGKIDVFLTVVLKNPKAVRLVNNTKKTFE